jgi:hypothetical protein
VLAGLKTNHVRFAMSIYIYIILIKIRKLNDGTFCLKS